MGSRDVVCVCSVHTEVEAAKENIFIRIALNKSNNSLNFTWNLWLT